MSSKIRKSNVNWKWLGIRIKAVCDVLLHVPHSIILHCSVITFWTWVIIEFFLFMFKSHLSSLSTPFIQPSSSMRTSVEALSENGGKARRLQNASSWLLQWCWFWKLLFEANHKQSGKLQFSQERYQEITAQWSLSNERVK